MAPPDTTHLDKSFLASCIYKGKPVRDVWESLGLFSSVNDTRKDPNFATEEANELYKKIKRIAKTFSLSYANSKEQLQVDLSKVTAFSSDALELGLHYGPAIWGRSDSSQESGPAGQNAGIELQWGEESDRQRIMFYIRCWIIRLIVKEFGTTLRKTPRKNLVRPTELCDDDINGSDSSGLSDIPFVPVANMLPPSTRGTIQPTIETWASAAARIVTSTSADTNTSVDVPRNNSTKHADSLTPSKRKAIDIDEGASNGKLPKPSKTGRPNQGPIRRQERDLYSIPRSPTVVANRVAETFAQQRIRESSYNTDRTWRPRDETAETETMADAGEVPGTELDMLMQSAIQLAEHDQSCGRREQDEPIEGPSGTYQDPIRQDSVIPGDTQPDTERAASEPGMLNSLADDPVGDGQISSRLADRASFEGTQEKVHRTELFKLLLSYLNGINQFSADTYSMEAEERMNMLLHQFRINDTEMLQAKLRVDFARLHIALESWMSMRHRLTEFRVATGYLGQPGEQWEEYLKRMPNVPCAHASLSYVELQENAGKDGESSYVVETFDEDLAKMFDLLTMVRGCNGPEAFKGIGSYNASLLEWFKQEG